MFELIGTINSYITELMNFNLFLGLIASLVFWSAVIFITLLLFAALFIYIIDFPHHFKLYLKYEYKFGLKSLLLRLPVKNKETLE